jgi:hypothetical protein
MFGWFILIYKLLGLLGIIVKFEEKKVIGPKEKFSATLINIPIMVWIYLIII